MSREQGRLDAIVNASKEARVSKLNANSRRVQIYRYSSLGSTFGAWILVLIGIVFEQTALTHGALWAAITLTITNILILVVGHWIRK